MAVRPRAYAEAQRRRISGISDLKRRRPPPGNTQEGFRRRTAGLVGRTKGSIWPWIETPSKILNL